MLGNSFAKILSAKMGSKQLWFAHREQTPQLAVTMNSKQLDVSKQRRLHIASREITI